MSLVFCSVNNRLPTLDGYVPFTMAPTIGRLAASTTWQANGPTFGGAIFVDVVRDLGGRIDHRDGYRLMVPLLRAANRILTGSKEYLVLGVLVGLDPYVHFGLTMVG